MSEFVSQLRARTDKIQVLRAFQHWVSNSETSSLMHIATDETFDALFDFLCQAKHDEVLLASEILHKLVSVVPVNARIPRLKNNFLRVMDHGLPEVREVVLKELKVCAQDNSAVEHVSGNQDLVIRIAKLIGDESLSVAMASCELLISFGSHLESAALILTPQVDKVLKTVMLTSDIFKLRVYETVVRIAASSPDNLFLVEKNGYFEPLLSDIRGDDCLVVLNCVEIVKDLAVSGHGLKYLNDVGFMKAVSDIFVTSLGPPPDFILLPGLLKFFISIGQLHTEYLFHQHNVVVHSLFSLIEGSDAVLWSIAVDGVGLLGISVPGKMLLHNEGRMLQVLESFRSNLLQGSTPEHKCCVIESLSNLLEVDGKERNIDSELESVLEKWFRCVSEDPGNMLFQLCRQPFLEVRQSALHLMHAVVGHEWGQKFMVSVPGFVEFLLDRSAEGTVTGKELKFKIISLLVNSPWFEQIFDTSTIDNMNEYYERGPFYVAAESVVAVDEPM